MLTCNFIMFGDGLNSELGFKHNLLRLKQEWVNLSLVKLLLWTFAVSYGYMRLED